MVTLATGEIRVPPRDVRRRENGEENAGHALRLDIQGLRALAVSLVVLSHAGVDRLSGGYVGVDVFFVISGFLITSLLHRELAATGRISLRGFYARRALRLLPLATLVSVTTLAGAWLFLSKVRFEEYAGDALGSVLYAMNLRLAGNETDYLDAGAPPSPLQHFWSLAVEEQFYLLWPLLLLLSWRLARGTGRDRITGRDIARRRRLALPLALPLAALCAVSLSLSVWLGSGPWAYFGSHTRFWELGTGALVALSAPRLARLPAALAAPMTWLGLGCIGLAAVRFDEATPFPGHHALLPVLGTALVLAGGCAPAPGDARLVLARRPAVWVGGLSYGWYLWHWPALIIGPAALDRPGGVRTRLALSAAALVLAWLTFRLVENPVRFHAAFRRRPRRALALGLGLTAGATALTLVAAAFPPQIPSGAPGTELGPALAGAPDPEAELVALVESAADVDRLPGNLSPPLLDIKEGRSAVYEDGCHVGFTSTETPMCEYGDPDSDTVVVLFGDSHAAQWFPALEPLAVERGWRLVSLTKASCKIAEVTVAKSGGPYDSCDEWRGKALEMIAELDPSLVLASSSEAGQGWRDNSRGAWTEGFAETFGRLTDTGAEVAALLDTPWPRRDAVECAAAHPLRLDACASGLPEAYRDPVRRAATERAAEASGVAVVDPLPWLCSGTGACPVVVGDTLVYRDANHMSEAYAEVIAPVLDQRLAALFGGSEVFRR
ncbi:acyltransferase family protein [Streptomyces sp. 6N223]|uniref:acyltransferase family protein n=1 Tax=Streptomyces sp. 6N223 TaxID=3457412 RepID=UPI003FCF8D9A